MMRMITTFFYLFLIVLGASFSVLNAQSIHIDLYVTSLTLPLSLVVIIVFGAGVLMGSLLFLRRYWRLRTECHRVKNQLKWTEKEIKNLRAIPLHDQH